MRDEEFSAFGEGVPAEAFITTGNIPLIVATERVRESTINSRTGIDVDETIVVGFAHISNAAYQTRDLDAIPPSRHSEKHTSKFQA